MGSFEDGMRAVRRERWTSARAAFERAASDGDARGFRLLGQLASQGKGEPEDPARAASLYLQGAKLGDGECEYNLGAMYALGRGVARDAQAAMDWYRRAAARGDLDAAFKVGVMLTSGELGKPSSSDFEAAERLWRTGKAAHHVPSMMFLGNLWNGLGTTKSAVQAALCYLDVIGEARASDADVREMQGAIHRLLPDLRPLAEAGDALAAFVLGGWHMVGEIDPTEAARWFEVAVSKKHPGALRSLAFLLLHGDIERDEARAVQLFEMAAEAGDVFAQLNLGSMYAKGEVVPKDSTKAIFHLTHAAEQGEVEAMARLGDALGGIDRDAEALGWYVKAAEGGHVGAMKAAADWYRDGFGGPVDLVQAVRFYFAMLRAGNGDGLHEVHGLAEQMTAEQIREAAALAGDPSLAAPLIDDGTSA